MLPYQQDGTSTRPRICAFQASSVPPSKAKIAKQPTTLKLPAVNITFPLSTIQHPSPDWYTYSIFYGQHFPRQISIHCLFVMTACLATTSIATIAYFLPLFGILMCFMSHSITLFGSAALKFPLIRLLSKALTPLFDRLLNGLVSVRKKKLWRFMTFEIVERQGTSCSS